MCVCVSAPGWVMLQDVLYSSDGSQVLSCSSDGTVRIWDAKTCEQLHGFRWGTGMRCVWLIIVAESRQAAVAPRVSDKPGDGGLGSLCLGSGTKLYS